MRLAGLAAQFAGVVDSIGSKTLIGLLNSPRYREISDAIVARHLGVADGMLAVEPHPVQDSSMLSVLARANGLLVRPAHDPPRAAGELVQVIDFSDLPGGY